MNEAEKKIIQQRTIEATHKGLMGISGKLGLIARYLGQEIVVQNDGSGYMSEFMGVTRTAAPLDYDLQEDSEIRTSEVLDAFGFPIENPHGYGWSEKDAARQQMSSFPIGWYFDGLHRRVHMDIKYIEEKSELIVHYKGYLVFREMAGELLTYTPYPEWEDHVESFYKTANKMNVDKRKQEKEERLKEAVKNKESWIQKLRSNWGI